LIRETALGCVHPPYQRNDDHGKRGQDGAAREAPPYEWKDQVEFDFDGKRPKDTVDRTVGRLPPGMDEEQMGDDLLPWRCAEAVEYCIAGCIRDDDREHVRRHDLDETPPGEVSPGRQRFAGKLGAHERERDNEAAQKEEEMNADEPGFGNELQPWQRRRQPRNLPNVVPEHEQHGDAAHSIKNAEPVFQCCPFVLRG
jgi:HEPN domain-containing protein